MSFKINDIVLIGRSNGVNQLATIWQIQENNVHVCWFENGRKIGKMVSSHAILELVKRPPPKRRYKLSILFRILLLFLILFLFASYDRYEKRIFKYYSCLELKAKEWLWFSECEKDISFLTAVILTGSDIVYQFNFLIGKSFRGLIFGLIGDYSFFVSIFLSIISFILPCYFFICRFI